MRLIDADALIEIITEWPDHLGILVNPTCEEYAERYGNLEALSAIRGEVEHLPTIDAVPVIRCKDCVYRGGYRCPMYHSETIFDDFDGFDDYSIDRTDGDGFCNRGKKNGR